jgi:hypothetical protein
MTSRIDIPLLVIGYQRAESIAKIFDLALSSGVHHLIISVDFPKDPNTRTLEIHNEIKNLIFAYENKFETMEFRFVESNQGCALHVLSSIDWAFGFTEEIIILEDDCIPSNAFFNFARNGFKLMEERKDIVLVSGTQHAPKHLSETQYFMSKYALTWGWATTRSNWRQIKSNMISLGNKTSLDFLCLDVNKIYWQEGARRAYSGYVDVWDTALVNYLQTSDKYSLLPRENLVTNIGNDSAATHMRGEKNWLFKDVGNYVLNSNDELHINEEADDWLAKNFYKIRLRHLATTRITRLLDRFRKPLFPKLLDRWCL